MPDKSLILRPWEVRAMLEGRLKQVRRVVKPQPLYDSFLGITNNNVGLFYDHKIGLLAEHFDSVKPPYAVGDTLRVKETWAYITDSDMNIIWGRKILYKATDPEYCVYKWRSPVTMPLWASRLSCVVTGVRVERVQEVTFDDAIACGVCEDPHGMRSEARNWYKENWNIDNPRYPWESNPWCWVYELGEVK